MCTTDNKCVRDIDISVLSQRIIVMCLDLNLKMAGRQRLVNMFYTPLRSRSSVVSLLLEFVLSRSSRSECKPTFSE